MPPRPDGRFANLDPTVRPRFDKFFRWSVVDKLAGKRRKAPRTAPIPVEQAQAPALETPGVVWLGHATSLITLGGARILTDPVFAPSLGAVIVRNVPAPLPPEALPAIDLVLISHNHRDHLDRSSLMAVEGLHKPRYVVPLGVDRYLTGWGVDASRITALDWWGASAPLPDCSDLQITCVPAQHWSQRTPFDRNRSLWGGFVLQADGASVYFAGDSGYFQGFKEIGRRFPKLDVALLPIGAYDPEWFMSPQHMNPEDAGVAFLDLGAARMIPIHWGTYKLSDEPLGEPPERLDGWRAEARVEAERVLTLPVGGRFLL